MRLNQFIARATGLSRRQVDEAIAKGRVEVNSQRATIGQPVQPTDRVTLDKRAITPVVKTHTLMLHKPVGYVVSRDGQGSKTIYDLLPAEYHSLKPVGRLDKDSSGLLLLTNDGELAHRLTHPSFRKQKGYVVNLDKELSDEDLAHIIKQGVLLEDGLSRLELDPISAGLYDWEVVMYEGRNRQIRRTFAALGYTVTQLHRTQFGPYLLKGVPAGEYRELNEHA